MSESQRSLQIELVEGTQARALLPALARLLRDAVEGGASVGFLLPLPPSEVEAFWEGVLREVVDGGKLLWVARRGGEVVGCVQLALAQRPNGNHRAEVQKLLVLQAARRQGIARALMSAMESEAQARNRSLLVLDTLAGDSAEPLYRSLGYCEAGVIPHFARDTREPEKLRATVLFYKWLGEEPSNP